MTPDGQTDLIVFSLPNLRVWWQLWMIRYREWREFRRDWAIAKRELLPAIKLEGDRLAQEWLMKKRGTP